MKIRILAATALALALAHSVALAQKGNNKCSDVPVRWVFAGGGAERITGDGSFYDGTLFVCGSNDAAMNVLTSNRRRVNFDFGGLVTINPDGTPSPDHLESWMPSAGALPLKAFLNVRALGTVRNPGQPTTTFLSCQFTGLDNKTYVVKMTPSFPEVGTGLTPNPPADVNSPWMTSPVTATFFSSGQCPSTAPSCSNPYGLWVVQGYDQAAASESGVTPPPQIGTIYKSLSTLIRVGQFSLPLSLTVTALAPLP